MPYPINEIKLSEIIEGQTFDKYGGNSKEATSLIIDSPVIDMRINSYSVSESLFVQISNQQVILNIWFGKTGHFQEMSLIKYYTPIKNIEGCSNIYKFKLGLPLFHFIPCLEEKYGILKPDLINLEICNEFFNVTWSSSPRISNIKFGNMFFSFDIENNLNAIGYFFKSNDEFNSFLNELNN